VSPFARHVLAGVAGLGGVLALFGTFGRHDYPLGVLPTILAVAAAVIIHIPRLGPQLVARAVWWSTLALGVLICAVGSGDERSWGFLTTSGAALALAVAGSRALTEGGERDAFAPVAFRTTFLLLMMLTLADAQTYSLFAIATVMDGPRHLAESGVFLFGTIGLVAAFVGLYRVTLWGALLAVVTNVAVAGVAPLTSLGRDTKFLAFIWILAGAEVLVAAPMLVAVLARKRIPEPAPALRTWGSRVVLAGLWLVALVSFAGRLR
jgi:hypothetical protein